MTAFSAWCVCGAQFLEERILLCFSGKVSTPLSWNFHTQSFYQKTAERYTEMCSFSSIKQEY
jgi:hypothetical protein